MCPLYPLHMVFLYLCLIVPLFFAVVQGSEELFAGWNLKFHPGSVEKLLQFNSTQIEIACEGCHLNPDIKRVFPNLELVVSSQDDFVASVSGSSDLEIQPEAVVNPLNQEKEVVFNLERFGLEAQTNWSVAFNLSANFLGFTSIRAKVRDGGNKLTLPAMTKTVEMDLSVVRKKTIQSKLFGYSVALLISIAYINMGCALDLSVVKESLKRPVGPAIGFLCQFMIMPLISFFLGYSFYDDIPMRLGLFVTGVSPGGGASNIWTLMFGGNLNLSVTMTAISTFAALFMMPLWLFTLGRVIFSDGNIIIPYHKIFTYAFCVVVPLSIGLLISRYLPRVSKFLVRILKPMALFLIMFILIFGVWANFYMFKLMTWKVWLTGMGLPWLGFAFGCSIARLTRRPVEDVIAIAIETGVQNTGISIFILWFTFEHPLGDIAAVVPVAAATMTPFPLLAALIMVKAKHWMGIQAKDEPTCPFNLQNLEEEAAAVAGGHKDIFKGSESNQKLMCSYQDEDEENDDVQKQVISEKA
ncbi:hypothetical protein TCAL_04892 [Tigriopus californicus]|uniref:Uncharacterized protein n=1 Tax=Tigriopus californicus TaxID=6832 RepID=A0A553NDK2_TIGCA|nr:ileal sodium/bile acid cotransporter-like [Tigriopus californicus]TRY63520.1 hypothetical protein TCAL_04892 [Tigriopus californicus]|eukprot:TCALIF_04892-PA protein Name:"Similar to SLC10A2 Ileal sodium/bile acid cotransporter (Cricetulus griseus)" AED:0.05 eAED:0.05 QI:437/1/1/1/1/1/2/309/525